MKKFLEILKIELKELEDNLEFFGELHRQREKSGEITSYVFRENMNLIQNEIAGLENLINSVDKLLPDTYSSFEEMVEDLDKRIKEKIHHSNYAEAVYLLVKRKFDKVHRYVQDET